MTNNTEPLKVGDACRDYLKLLAFALLFPFIVLGAIGCFLACVCTVGACQDVMDSYCELLKRILK
jgi:hypothetical protein